MLVAPSLHSTGPHEAKQSTKSSRSAAALVLKRRNTFSGGDTRATAARRGGSVLLHLRRRSSRAQQSLYSENRLSCVEEQADSPPTCSQQLSYKPERKVSAVNDIVGGTAVTTGCGAVPVVDTTRRRTESETEGEIDEVDGEESCTSKGGSGMARNKSKTLSPGPPPFTAASGGGDGPYSWLEALSSKFIDRKTKRKSNGIFGSLRGGKTTGATGTTTAGSTTTSRGGEKWRKGPEYPLPGSQCPRSPLLMGHRDTTVPSKRRIPKNPQEPAGSRDSTGFDHTDSFSVSSQEDLSLSLSRSDFGSCQELSSKLKSVVSVRKSNSLPRTVLCSPVLSRRGKRPSSQWVLGTRYLADDIGGRDSLLTSPSSSSHHGSADTLQGQLDSSNAFAAVTTPTDVEGGGDWSLTPPPTALHGEVVNKTSLTRSSSMPFETLELAMEKKPPPRDMIGRLSLPAVGRLAMRSQSFNTHFSTHSQVQRTQSQEAVVMREHIVRFLLETEQSYILSLKTLTKDYSPVLDQIDCHSLKEVLKLVSQMATEHVRFSRLVDDRINSWHGNQMIGDVLLNTFSQQQFVMLYTTFIQHYSEAKTTLDAAKQSKSSLTKALEELSRENHGKLSVEDLLIKPVQRIPRYLLFVKDLLKQTHPGHPDFVTLQQAHCQLSIIANRVDESQRLSGLLHLRKELLTTVEGLSDVVTESSSLLRCDHITEVRGSAQKKDRLLMLFSDVIVCASTRRRSTGFRKGSLMNMNSLQNDMLKYRIKWTSSTANVTINHSQTPLMERRKYNTLEKTLHNLHQDETIILQMISSSSSLHCPHQELSTVLQETLTSLRDAMTERRQEMESLQMSHETARVDLTIHVGSPPNKFSLVFSSQKDRQEWEHVFRNLQASSPRKQRDLNQTAATGGVGSTATAPRFLWHVCLPSCRVGSELSSVAFPTDYSNQFFVSINDSGGRGNIAILSTRNRHKDTPPQLVATLPLSSSRLLCSLCVEHKSQHAKGDQITDNVSEGSSPSSESTLSARLEEEDFLFPTTPTSATSRSDPSSDTPSNSHSAPPTSHPNTASSYIADVGGRYDLAPPIPDGNQWLWLGSVEGTLHILKVGVASLHVSSSISIRVGAPVLCLLADRGNMWVGLGNGRIAMFNLSQEINQPERFLSVSTSPIKAIVTMGEYKLVATGNRIVGVNPDLMCKELMNCLEPIEHMTVNDEWVFIAFKKSTTIHVCSCNGVAMETAMTIDCGDVITSSLKYYDPIIQQHKSTDPFITSFTISDSMLLVGTSAGVLVSMPFPLSLGKPPTLHALTRGHVDSVSTLSTVPQGSRQFFISGGHGLEELSRAKASENVSETEGCLLFWYLSSKQRNVT